MNVKSDFVDFVVQSRRIVDQCRSHIVKENKHARQHMQDVGNLTNG